MKNLIILILLSLSHTALSQKYTLSGYVRDESTGENLIGATIYASSKKVGTTSNYYGHYSLTLPKGTTSLTVSYIGYNSRTVIFDLNSDTTLSFSLTTDIQLEEVVVQGELMESQRTQMSIIKVKAESIKSLPSLMGEADVLKTLQLLPGVQSGSEGSSGLYVRGGGADQNLILLDGVPVYNASHLFGFFSVFNADAINNVELIKGGFPARYGGRLSSVVDINLKEGNKKKIRGEGSIGLISAKLTLDGPIGKKTSFLISGRRTYIDLLTSPLVKAASKGDVATGYYFYDVNAKINHTFNEKDRIYLSAYTGLDKAYARVKYKFDGTSSKEDINLNWGNLTTAFRWNHLYSPKLFSNLTATFSRYKFDIGAAEESETRDSTGVKKDAFSYSYFSDIRDIALKMDFDYTLNPHHKFLFGANMTNHVFRPGVAAIESTVENDTTFGASTARSNEFYLYLEDEINVNDKLFLNVGIHNSGFSTKDKVYASMQPRLSARYTLNGTSSVKASFVRMTQYVHLLTNSGVGLPTDLWVPATKNIKPQDAVQFALGYAKDMSKGYVFSAEAYYKDMKNLIEYKEGASYFGVNSDWESKVTAGNGNSYGLELLLKKNTGKFNGWIGYTWSKTFRKFPDLNEGLRFPYTYDRRHDLSVNTVYEPKEGLKLSATWVYGTGNAISLPIGKYQSAFRSSNTFSDRQDLKDYGGKNDFRMKAYHRLDLAIAWTRQKPKMSRTWTLGAYNSYSRANPFFVDFGTHFRTGEKGLLQYSLFPILPFVRYSISF